MKLSLGIVGLPNVGKSTLFNALTKLEIAAENYPFCTIDPNVGIVTVHDERIWKISEMVKPAKTVPAVVEFVDIAGLVKGASTGEGLGNQFLANIRETSAIVHLVRGFKDSSVTHVENSVDPLRDIDLINTELVLKDLETVAKRLGEVRNRAKLNKDLQSSLEFIEAFNKHLEEGKLAIDFPESTDEKVQELRKTMFLLTDKPVIYLVNSDDADRSQVIEKVKSFVGNKRVIGMDIKTEYELTTMSDEDRKMFMEELGMAQTGLDLLTQEAYKLLGLISYFTQGPTEVRAWTIKNGETAPEAASAIHNDFKNKFIAADVCAYSDFVELGGWNKAKDFGKVRLEGKEYIVKDGDIMVFRHGS